MFYKLLNSAALFPEKKTTFYLIILYCACLLYIIRRSIFSCKMKIISSRHFSDTFSNKLIVRRRMLWIIRTPLNRTCYICNRNDSLYMDVAAQNQNGIKIRNLEKNLPEVFSFTSTTPGWLSKCYMKLFCLCSLASWEQLRKKIWCSTPAIKSHKTYDYFDSKIQ